MFIMAGDRAGRKRPPAMVQDITTCTGRLTLTTATYVTTADVTAAGTLYFTGPNGGNWRTWLHDGDATWTEFNKAEISLSLTLTSGKNYDVWLYNNSGTATLEVLVWTDDTTRATALATKNGVIVKSGATTRRYLGTIRASAANQVEDSAAKRFVWNFYNQRQRRLAVTDATNTWTHITPDQWNQANASSANQVALVVGDATAMMDLWALSNANMSGNPSGRMQVGIDQDGTNANDAEQRFRVDNASGTSAGGNATLQCAHMFRAVPLGYHYYAWVERSEFTANWFGDGGSADLQSGLQGWVMG